MEDKIDYSEGYDIKVTKVKYKGNFIHWEAHLHSFDGELDCEVTAPTMGGAIDECLDYLYDMRYEWTRDDANNRG